MNALKSSKNAQAAIVMSALVVCKLFAIVMLVVMLFNCKN
jgi:hypothetical protein